MSSREKVCGIRNRRREAETSLPALPVKPFFEREGIALYLGDALELLPLVPPGSIDAVITDPPYCSGGRTAAERTMSPITKYCQNSNDCGRPTFQGDARDQRSFAFWCTLWMLRCRQALKPNGYVLSFSDWRQLPTMTDVIQAAGYTWRGIIAWDKGGGARAPHKGYFRHQCEYVAWGTNGACPAAIHAGPFPGCYFHSVKKSDKHHMTGKPTPLMLDLVNVVPPGGIILEPFAGSATTLVAALETGRRAIGFELTKEYCQIAAARLEAVEPRSKMAA